jgi:hypothetical protein
MALEADSIVENEGPAARATEDDYFVIDAAIWSFVKRDQHLVSRRLGHSRAS